MSVVPLGRSSALGTRPPGAARYTVPALPAGPAPPAMRALAAWRRARLPLPSPCRALSGRGEQHAKAVQTALEVGKAEQRAPSQADSWPADAVVRYSGEGLHLGVRCAWSLLVRGDGAFVDECVSPHLRSVVGFDGGAASQCWEIDGMGVPKQLELDDHEHCLMSNWVRSGFWLQPEARQRLDLLPCGPEEDARTPEMQHTPDSAATTSGADHSESSRRIRLRDGAIVGEVRGGQEPAQPASLLIQILGKMDTHLFADWERHAEHCFPRSYRVRAAAGSENSFTVQRRERLAPWQRAAAFAMPPAWLLPPDASYAPAGGGPLPAWWTASGHILVQPELDGRQLGYMILDTGASGFVIEAAAANAAGMVRFGSFHCAGMMDAVRIALRRCGRLRLGPLTVRDPLFMEMQLGGLVRGAPGPVVGIIGYDVFRRAVVDIPHCPDRSGQFTIQLHDPAQYAAPAELQPHWHALEFVSSLPLIRARIRAGGREHPVRLMIDSGAGGVDLMFNQRATDELGLLDHIPCSSRMIKSVGGEKTERKRVQSGVLPELALGASRFARLDCLFIGSAGLDLSHYVQGIVCSQLVARCRTVLDFARRRIALVPAEPEPAAAAGGE